MHLLEETILLTSTWCWWEIKMPFIYLLKLHIHSLNLHIYPLNCPSDVQNSRCLHSFLLHPFVCVPIHVCNTCVCCTRLLGEFFFIYLRNYAINKYLFFASCATFLSCTLACIHLWLFDFMVIITLHLLMSASISMYLAFAFFPACSCDWGASMFIYL